MARLTARAVHGAEEAVGENVPYSHHLTPSILATRSGEYLSVWRIGGRSHQTASADELAGWVADLNNALRGIAAADLAFWSHIVRRREDGHLEGDFDNYFCRRLDDRYRALLQKCRFMVNELYLTIIVRTVGDEVLEKLGRWDKASLEEKLRRQADGIARLEELNRVLRSALRRYDAELLETYEHNGRVFSVPLEFLALLANGERLPMPVCRGRFGDYMVANRPFFSWHGEIGEVRTPTKVRRFGMMEVVEYDGSGTSPGELNGLLSSDFEFVLSQSWSCLSRHAAKGFLDHHKKRLIESQDVAKSQVSDIDRALDQLVSGEFVLGEHHATLLAWGVGVDDVRKHLAWARGELLDRGILAKPVDLALEAAFWAQLPGNWQFRPRPAAITSQNFLCFSPFHNFMRGKATGNPWGPAVTLLKTASGTPLHFNFHASAEGDREGERLLGNTVILGQSSAGKTVLLGFLLAQAQRFRPRVVVFDKDRGMELTVRAMGGRYFALKVGQPSGWNPLQLDPSPANRLFMTELVQALATGDGPPLSPAETQAIEAAVGSLTSLIDHGARRLSTLLQFCEAGLQTRLQKWCAGGQYGWVFDNETDLLDLTTHEMYGFDLTEFLDNATVCGPMMRYLTLRTEAMIDGRRFIYIFDEWWKALRNRDFALLSENKGRTIRKQDGILVLCTQQPSAVLRSPEGLETVKECATMVLLRNPTADRKDYVEGLKLSEREFELVRSLPEDSRYFLVKQGSQSTLAELELGPLQAELKVLSGTPDRAVMVEQLVAEHGEEPEKWLPRFWERLGVPA